MDSYKIAIHAFYIVATYAPEGRILYRKRMRFRGTHDAFKKLIVANEPNGWTFRVYQIRLLETLTKSVSRGN